MSSQSLVLSVVVTANAVEQCFLALLMIILVRGGEGKVNDWFVGGKNGDLKMAVFDLNLKFNINLKDFIPVSLIS